MSAVAKTSPGSTDTRETPTTPSLSVLMALYYKERPAHLRECLDSLCWQTLQANEIVIVKDGPLTDELESVLHEFETRLPLKVLALSTNQGTGVAVRLGLEQCTGELVARADSDDIYAPTRFQKQVQWLVDNSGISIVSAAGAEFEADYRRPFCIRRAPVGGRELQRFARYRNPITYQQATIFRRADALAAGNYQDSLLFEDYDLWARMMLRGCEIYNMPEVLAFIRCGNGMINRRRGWKYVRCELSFLGKMRRIGFLSPAQYVANVVMRVPLRLLPAGTLGRFYRVFLRKPAETSEAAG